MIVGYSVVRFVTYCFKLESKDVSVIRMDGNEGETATERPSVREKEKRSELPSTAIVMAVAAATGVEPDALPPLYDRIEPDALDDLFRTPDGTARDVRVSFFYGGCAVTVEHESIRVELREGTRSSRPV